MPTWPGEWDWDFESTRLHHLEAGLRMTPAERLRWLDQTMEEMSRLHGLARKGRPIGTAETPAESRKTGRDEP
jgi:hypothetical protein